MAEEDGRGSIVMQGQAVVVTGASSGIGRACCLHLDSEGYRVFAAVRKPYDGESLRREASESLTPVLMDITEPGEVSKAAEYVGQSTGETGLAGLINNAGIAIVGPLEFLPIEELTRQLSVNVIGQIVCSQAFLPLLRMGRGRIINVGSISGRIALPFLGPYAASKAALASLSDALRRELLPWGISVSLLEPGNIQSPFREKSLAAADSILSQLPAAAEKLYGNAFEKQREARMSVAEPTKVKKVARLIHYILEVKNPKPRYLLGRDARFAAMAVKLFPVRILDRLLGLRLS